MTPVASANSTSTAFLREANRISRASANSLPVRHARPWTVTMLTTLWAGMAPG